MEGNATNFASECLKGSLGETKFIQYLQQNNYYFKDVRLHKDYQLQDIDFIVKDKTFEVKTDYNLSYTGNVVIELELYRNGAERVAW